MSHHFMLLRLNSFSLDIEREGWWFEHYVSLLQILLHPHDVKIVSWPWLSYLREWGSLTMRFTGKFVYMAHHFILLHFNPFGLRIDIQRWWFEHSVSGLQVCSSAEGTKNVSWHSLSPLRGYVSLTMAFSGKFVYRAYHFILLRLNQSLWPYRV